MTQSHGWMLSRRDLLKGLIAAGGGVLLPGVSQSLLRGLEAPVVRAAGPVRVVVVGAGFAGLATAWELRRRGMSVRVLEGRSRVGGRVYTLRGYFASGQYADLGAEFVDVNHPTLLGYLKTLAIPVAKVPKGRNGLFFNGQFKDEHHIGDYGPGVEADVERFEAQSEWLGTQVPDPRQPWKGPDPVRLDRISLDEWMDRLKLQPFVKKYYGAWLSGCYATDLRDLSLLMYARDMKVYAHVPAEGELAYRIPGGSSTLAEAFAARLGDAIDLEATVEAIEHDAAGVRVHYRRGGRMQTAEGAYAVLTVPTTMLRGIELRPGLSKEKQQSIDGLAYGGLAKVLLQYRQRFWRRRGFSGFTITELPIHCTWDATGNQTGRRGIMTCFLGGAEAERIGRMSPRERIDWAAAQVEKIYPGSRRHFEQGASIYWNDQRFTRGSYSHYSPGTMTVIGPIIALPEGRLHFAGEHTDMVQGYMEGALASGRRAAAEIGRRAQGQEIAFWSLDRHLRRLERVAASSPRG